MKPPVFCGLFLVVFSMITPAWARVIYVNASAKGLDDGLSWPNAFQDMQKGLAAAEDGDEIWVAAGTYKTTAGTDRTISFRLVANVAIYGGFAGTETNRFQRNWETHPVILSGDIGLKGDNSDNSYHVVVAASRATLDGFTIRDGNAADTLTYPWSLGAGMFCESAESLTLTHCNFRDNEAADGGGLYSYRSSLTVRYCTFSGNSSSNSQGGGMYNWSGSLYLSHCLFVGNTALGWYFGCGGGMYNIGMTMTILNSTFTGNTARSAGGGMYCYSTLFTMKDCVLSDNLAVGTGGYGGGLASRRNLPSLVNCVFSGNEASRGGGINSDWDYPSDLKNCTFIHNLATFWGGGLYYENGASATVTNCILWDNTATTAPEIRIASGASLAVKYSDIKGSRGSGAQWNTDFGADLGGNIEAAPLFVHEMDPDGPDDIWRTIDDGLRLQAGSKCVNAGTAYLAPEKDILGIPRKNGPDMGAYEAEGTKNGARGWIWYR
ncbi:right-handed parallel beta-helix repeat-containing protein [bacterium]|nr:right-handed parallel beta-helix repeat-containing protein [bacterium]